MTENSLVTINNKDTDENMHNEEKVATPELTPAGLIDTSNPDLPVPKQMKRFNKKFKEVLFRLEHNQPNMTPDERLQMAAKIVLLNK